MKYGTHVFDTQILKRHPVRLLSLDLIVSYPIRFVNKIFRILQISLFSIANE